MASFKEHLDAIDEHLTAIFTEPEHLDRLPAATLAFIFSTKHEFDKLKEVVRQNEKIQKTS